jgi:hypothetical protein
MFSEGHKDMSQKPNRWAWLPQMMPGVARLIADKRKEVGSAHVDECWQRGVINGESGWFFAREGAIAVGTIWPAAADVAGWQFTATQCMLITAPLDGHAVR